MKVRVASALVGLALLLPIIYVGGHVFAWSMFVLGLVGLYEIARMQKIDYFSSIGLVATIGLGFVLIPEKYWFAPITHFNASFLFYICCMVLLVLTVYKQEHFSFVDASTLVFGALYIGYGFRYLIEIRDLGLKTIAFVFLVIWATDSGAYIVGRRFGKHKLAPKISPNKTFEGSIGGVLVAVLCSALYIAFVEPNLAGVNRYIWLTIFLSIAGQFGDLIESAYKRHFGVKDSGNLLPGHGGVLDRFDSTISASVMFMVFIHLIK
ncbi:MAG: phosphatidate cytidylyltransferase [Aerococcaceae bacterium]|nr:phosphatidate cytidylyltransferase [Aerococcaceae bacterium]